MQLTVVFFLTVVVAQVAYLLFITLEVLSSNPAIRNIKNNVCVVDRVNKFDSSKQISSFPPLP